MWPREEEEEDGGGGGGDGGGGGGGGGVGVRNGDIVETKRKKKEGKEWK